MIARPILMSAPMVCGCKREAEQAGSGKSQTRRTRGLEYFSANDPNHWRCVRVRDGVSFMVYKNTPHEHEVKCPYGKAGDVLWVRENIFQFGGPIEYAADDGTPSFKRKMTPSIHMPKWASRLTLKITDVRVERLQSISEEDAKAEGVRRHDWQYENGEGPETYRDAYACLWDHINGEGSWDQNPWCWCIQFECIQRNVDEVLRDARVAA